MKKVLFITLLSILAGYVADAALVGVSKTNCKQNAEAVNNIDVCNFTGVTFNISGGGNVILPGCNATVNAEASNYQNQQCSSRASG